MTLVAVTQRVTEAQEYQERRDALDQRWTEFLEACGIMPLVMPNRRTVADALFSDSRVAGLLLTGGNDFADLGGDAPERDETEKSLFAHALERSMPVLGVCRGMLLLQRHFGGEIARVSGHVAASQMVTVGLSRQCVNSYHNFGACLAASVAPRTLRQSTR
jgi:N5-(cytidine 5'-diphosphoramidyl)-L-glutamine hydrolase